MIPKLDRFAWFILLCTCFSLCTTRPVDNRGAKPVTIQAEGSIDKYDAVLSKVEQVEHVGDSLSTLLSTAISSARVQPKQLRFRQRTEHDIAHDTTGMRGWDTDFTEQ